MLLCHVGCRQTETGFGSSGVADLERGWWVRGRVMDAQTGAPVPYAELAIRLLRDGERIGRDGVAITGVDGWFEAFAPADFPQQIDVPKRSDFQERCTNGALASPPDQIQVHVWSGDHEGSTFVCTVDAVFQELEEVNGVPMVERIELPPIGVRFVPRVGVMLDLGVYPLSLATGDLDGDSDLDLAVAGKREAVSVLRNEGDGTFQDVVIHEITEFVHTLSLGDIENDGDLDLIVGNSLRTSLLINRGDGTLVGHVAYESGGAENAMVIGDLNDDGAMDIVVAGAEVSVLLGNGDGTFVGPVVYEVDGGAEAAMIGDLDEDSDQDLAIATYIGREHAPFVFSHHIEVLLNQGDGTFSAPFTDGTNTYASAMVAADFDGDGDLDIGVANSLTQNIFVVPNNGDGTFTEAVGHCIMNHRQSHSAQSLASGDLNDDGYPDVVALGSGRIDNVVVLLNHGDATFSEAERYTAGYDPMCVVLADLDGEGQLDIAVAGLLGDLSVFLNPPLAP